MKSENFFLKTRDGSQIFCRNFYSNKKKTIIVLHGIAEHSGRHLYLTDLLANHYNIVFCDLRGHGRSQGLKGHIDDFSLYLDDLEDLIIYLRQVQKMDKYLFFAHSMGALIVWAFLRRRSFNFKPTKVFLCSPPVLVPGRFGKLLPSSLLKALLLIPFNIWLPRPFSIKTLSHDPKNEQRIICDELCFSSFSKQLLVGLAKCSQENFSNYFKPDCPVCVVTGTEDKVVYSANVVKYFKNCGTLVKVRSIKGAYHELHNEIEKYRKPYFKFVCEFFL